MSSDNGDGTKVVQLPGTKGRLPVHQPALDPELEALITVERPGCQHIRVHVTVDRRVKCRDCDRFIDPVDYVLTLAKHWQHYTSEHRRVVRDLNVKRRELVELKRQERNAKARRRRAS